MRHNQILLILLSFIQLISSSRGDQKSEFINCLKDCISTQCDIDGSSKTVLPIYLRLTMWTCEDECKYECMQIEYKEMKVNNSVEQFYGKWPFYRVLGIQEIASFIFSILNGYQHFKGLKRLLFEVNFKDSYRYIWIGYAFVSLNTWIWSTIFHARDTSFTEKMDYFSAYLSIVYSLYMSVPRIFGFEYKKQPNLFGIWSIICLSLYIYHIWYLSIDFDYQYNMLANVVTGGTHNLLWFFWSIFNSKFYPNIHPNRWAPSIVCLSISLAMSLELLDFPAVFGLFDAHSLWHFSTIFIIPRWYDFFVKDINFRNLDFVGNRVGVKQF